MSRRIRINGNLYEALEDNRKKEISDWWDDLDDIKDDLKDLKMDILLSLKNNSEFSSDKRKYFQRMSKALAAAENSLLDVGIILTEIEPSI